LISFAPIVEGHGEVESVRILIHRIWPTLNRSDWPQVLPPIRIPKGRLVQAEHLQRAVSLAAGKLRGSSTSLGVVTLFVDADQDCPGVLGPNLDRIMADARPDVARICCVVNIEYETWLVASAGSMSKLLNLEGEKIPENPEDARLGKSWIA